jgi:hypothetical protein
VTIVALEKGISVTYSEFVSVALAIQHVKRMRSYHLLLVSYSSALSHKLRDFRKTLLNMKFVF